VKSEGILKTTVAVSPKPSFLLNERVYTKLSVERDQLWAVNALEAAGMRDLKDMGLAWSVASIYFIVNPKSSRTVRETAMGMVERVLLSLEGESRFEGAANIVLGMEDWLRQVPFLGNKSDLSSWPKSGKNRLRWLSELHRCHY